MTTDMINQILDAMARGTMVGISAAFWVMDLAAIWKWFLGVMKRFLHWVNPKWFNPKTEEADKN
jgi:hypothetical protein|nr:MAG TPA_asm: hypothetical protein [Caudoviricetes sp.]